MELPGVGAGGPHGGDVTPGPRWCQPSALPALGPTSCTITSVSFCLKMAFCALKCVRGVWCIHNNVERVVQAASGSCSAACNPSQQLGREILGCSTRAGHALGTLAKQLIYFFLLSLGVPRAG